MAKGDNSPFSYGKLSGFAAFKKLETHLEEQEQIGFITERFRGKKRKNNKR